MSSPSTASLFNVDVECNSLAILLKHPDQWGEFHLIDPSDYSEAHRPIFEHIALQLNKTPPGSVDYLLLSEVMRQSGKASLLGGFEIAPYLEGLCNRYVDKGQAAAYVCELKRLRVRRDLIVEMDAAKRNLIEKPNSSFIEMTAMVERRLSSITTAYHVGDQFTNVFDGFKEINEQRAANPVDASQMGWLGPFPTVNTVLGGVLDKHLMVTVGARTGNQKSSLGFHYHVHIAEKYGIPVLLLDCGEMTRERIRDRAACCLSGGRIPLWAIKSGEWGQNKDLARIMRGECYPRADKLRIDYINVGGMTPQEKLSAIRRYYYQKVGRGAPLAILDDYLKGIESFGRNTSEYQAIGYYVNDIKNLITNEIPASFWTSVQNNRSGVYQGKRAADLSDSEDQMGLSDRIIQQSDWGFILRFKVPEETAAERDLFGNMRLTPVKTREALGKEYEKALRPVKMPNGKFATNFFHLDTRGFYFTEKGDLHSALQILGKATVDLGADPEPRPKVQPL